jgi:DNA-directed RNA polymerase specialized sigma24 family protein
MRRDDEYTEFVAARLQALRRIAYLLCHDWHHADDLVQLTITRLYVHWHRVGVMDNPEAYTRTILVRQFLRERGSGWARKVSLLGELPNWLEVGNDYDDAIDVNAALAELPSPIRARDVRRLIKTLPPRTRTAVDRHQCAACSIAAALVGACQPAPGAGRRLRGAASCLRSWERAWLVVWLRVPRPGPGPVSGECGQCHTDHDGPGDCRQATAQRADRRRRQ